MNVVKKNIFLYVLCILSHANIFGMDGDITPPRDYATSRQLQSLEKKYRALQASIALMHKSLRQKNKKIKDLQKQHSPIAQLIAASRYNHKHNPFHCYEDALYHRSPQTHMHMLEAQDYAWSEILLLPPADYKNIGEQKEESITKRNGFVETIYRVSLPASTDYPPVHIVTVHGTASTTEQFAGNKENILTPAYIVFAQQLAQATQRPTYLHAFSWSGALSIKKRQEAGHHLADYIAGLKKRDPKSQIWTYAHSHGCNVAIHAADKLKSLARDEKEEPTTPYCIDTALFLGPPAFDIKQHEVSNHQLNITATTILWGDKDFVGSLGSLHNSWTWSNLSDITTSLRKDHAKHEQEYIRNIRLKLNNEYLNHLTIQHVGIRFLAAILQYTGQHFPCNYDLVYNITTQSEEQEDTSVYTIAGALEADDAMKKLFEDAPQYTRMLAITPELSAVYKNAHTESEKNIACNPYLLHKPDYWGSGLINWTSEASAKLFGPSRTIVKLFSPPCPAKQRSHPEARATSDQTQKPNQPTSWQTSRLISWLPFFATQKRDTLNTRIQYQPSVQEVIHTYAQNMNIAIMCHAILDVSSRHQ